MVQLPTDHTICAFIPACCWLLSGVGIESVCVSEIWVDRIAASAMRQAFADGAIAQTDAASLQDAKRPERQWQNTFRSSVIFNICSHNRSSIFLIWTASFFLTFKFWLPMQLCYISFGWFQMLLNLSQLFLHITLSFRFSCTGTLSLTLLLCQQLRHTKIKIYFSITDRPSQSQYTLFWGFLWLLGHHCGLFSKYINVSQLSKVVEEKESLCSSGHSWQCERDRQLFSWA